MDQYNLKLVDYSFVYSRDKYAPGDNFTWFLLKNKLCLSESIT